MKLSEKRAAETLAKKAELKKRQEEIRYQLSALHSNPSCMTPTEQRFLKEQALKYGVKL